MHRCPLELNSSKLTISGCPKYILLYSVSFLSSHREHLEQSLCMISQMQKLLQIQSKYSFPFLCLLISVCIPPQQKQLYTCSVCLLLRCYTDTGQFISLCQSVEWSMLCLSSHMALIWLGRPAAVYRHYFKIAYSNGAVPEVCSYIIMKCWYRSEVSWIAKHKAHVRLDPTKKKTYKRKPVNPTSPKNSPNRAFSWQKVHTTIVCCANLTTLMFLSYHVFILL